MYLNFFGLKKEPFQITPDPEFLFLSASHREALASIIYGIEKRKGFIAIIGGVGLGKTTIFRSYLERINKRQIRTIYIFNPNVSFKSLLKTIFQELDIAPVSDDTVEMVNRLHDVLIAEYREGRNIVLAIDEAQNIPIPTLENLRMLSNLETARDKLIQIVFIGQPEFDEMLKTEALRQINQRIAMRSTILPLTRKESAAYIKHRLARAQQGGGAVFTEDAINKISVRAGGIPRTINILCDNALVTAYGYQKKPVSAKIVGEIIRDFDRRKLTSPLKWKYAPAFAAALIAAVFWMYGRDADRMAFVNYTPGPPVLLKPAEVAAPEAARAGYIRQPIQAPAKASMIDGAGADPAKAGPEPVLQKSSDAAFRKASQKADYVRTIKKGDTLSSLIREQYGYVDDRMITLVRDSNPWIKNSNMIFTGFDLVLPYIDKTKNEKER